MAAIGEKRERLLWVDRLCRWGIGLFFLIAAVPKLFDVAGFAAVIDAYGILPDSLLLPMAVGLPVMEIILAVGLLLNRLPCKAGVAALLLVFIAVLSYAIWLGLDIDCGCFGPEDPERQAFHGLKTALVRDIVMLLPLAYSFWYHRYRYKFQV
ncbi:MAG: methylamine utilization protein [uncultured bacterium]|nr:MAG: methylamine utilization protein [uncultured bacterium]